MGYLTTYSSLVRSHRKLIPGSHALTFSLLYKGLYQQGYNKHSIQYPKVGGSGRVQSLEARLAAYKVRLACNLWCQPFRHGIGSYDGAHSYHSQKAITALYQGNEWLDLQPPLPLLPPSLVMAHDHISCADTLPPPQKSTQLVSDEELSHFFYGNPLASQEKAK